MVVSGDSEGQETEDQEPEPPSGVPPSQWRHGSVRPAQLHCYYLSVLGDEVIGRNWTKLWVTIERKWGWRQEIITMDYSCQWVSWGDGQAGRDTSISLSWSLRGHSCHFPLDSIWAGSLHFSIIIDEISLNISWCLQPQINWITSLPRLMTTLKQNSRSESA